jgi:catechol 2,3-dioxygenase-like lactoylglutathione lyase family enzyme
MHCVNVSIVIDQTRKEEGHANGPVLPGVPGLRLAVLLMATSRIQLALNVSDLDEAVAFYGKLFGAEPAKRRPGYANFAVDRPPLKLVLIEGEGPGGSLNHLGVEVASTEQVAEATERLAAEGLDTRTEDAVTCCYAVQDKVWVSDPDGAHWEVYTVLADASTYEACC